MQRGSVTMPLLLLLPLVDASRAAHALKLACCDRLELSTWNRSSGVDIAVAAAPRHLSRLVGICSCDDAASAMNKSAGLAAGEDDQHDDAQSRDQPPLLLLPDTDDHGTVSLAQFVWHTCMRFVAWLQAWLSDAPPPPTASITLEQPAQSSASVEGGRTLRLCACSERGAHPLWHEAVGPSDRLLLHHEPTLRRWELSYAERQVDERESNDEIGRTSFEAGEIGGGEDGNTSWSPLSLAVPDEMLMLSPPLLWAAHRGNATSSSCPEEVAAAAATAWLASGSNFSGLHDQYLHPWIIACRDHDLRGEDEGEESAAAAEELPVVIGSESQSERVVAQDPDDKWPPTGARADGAEFPPPKDEGVDNVGSPLTDEMADDQTGPPFVPIEGDVGAISSTISAARRELSHVSCSNTCRFASDGVRTAQPPPARVWHSVRSPSPLYVSPRNVSLAKMPAPFRSRIAMMAGLDPSTMRAIVAQTAKTAVRPPRRLPQASTSPPPAYSSWTAGIGALRAQRVSLCPARRFFVAALATTCRLSRSAAPAMALAGASTMASASQVACCRIARCNGTHTQRHGKRATAAASSSVTARAGATAATTTLHRFGRGNRVPCRPSHRRRRDPLRHRPRLHHLRPRPRHPWGAIPVERM